MVFADAIKRTWKQIIYFNSGALVDGTPKRSSVNIELPDAEDFDFDDNLEIISDERGVRIAREAGD